jgi:thiamine pyrophosphokinase
MELEMKGNETKFLIASRKPYNENEYVKPGIHNLEIVKDYTYTYVYLGTNLTNKNELTL